MTFRATEDSLKGPQFFTCGGDKKLTHLVGEKKEKCTSGSLVATESKRNYTKNTYNLKDKN